MDIRIVVACKPDEAALPGLLGSFKSFDGASGTEDLLDFSFLTHSVNLPEVDVVRAEPLEGKVQLRLRAGAGAVIGLGRNEDMLAKGRKHGSVNLFRAAIPVIHRIIEIVDPKVIGPESDGFSFLKGNQRKAAACLANHGKLLAGLSERPTGNIAHLGFWRPCSRGCGSQTRKNSAYKCSAPHGTSFHLMTLPDFNKCSTNSRPGLFIKSASLALGQRNAVASSRNAQKTGHEQSCRFTRAALMHGPSSVYIQGLASDHIAIRRRQKDCGSRNISRRDARLQTLLGHNRAHLLGSRHFSLFLRLNRPRRDGIHLNVEFTHIARQGSCESDDAALRSNVMHQMLGRSHPKGDGRDVDDFSLPILFEIRKCGASAKKTTPEIHPLDVVPLLRCHFVPDVSRIDAGIVDKDVEVPK